MSFNLNMSQLLRFGINLFTGLTICSLSMGCKQNKTHTVSKDKTQITTISTHLSVMLKATKDPFLIIEEKHSKKFVQFYAEKQASIVLDVPLVALTSEEQERAKTYFKAYQMEIIGPKGMKTYRKLFPSGEMNKISQIALGTFKDVYGINSPQLVFQRGWEK